MFCEKCGKQLEEGTKFCDGCGAEQVPVQQTSSAAGVVSAEAVKNKGVTLAVLGVAAVVLIFIVVGLFNLIGGLFSNTPKWGWSEKKIEKYMEKKDAEKVGNEEDDNMVIVEYELKDKDLGEVEVEFVFDKKGKLCGAEVSAEDDEALVKKLKKKYGKGKEVNGCPYWDKGKTFGMMEGSSAVLFNKKHDNFKSQYQAMKQMIELAGKMGSFMN